MKLAITRFEPWFQDPSLPFFPEYTDHGIDHVNAVLTTATSLIRDESWPSITPHDAAVLIIAVLLHDCALHLSEDGFNRLLVPSRASKGVPGFNDRPWDILWEDFLSEARRFDGRTLYRLFGDVQPIRRPPKDPRDLTKRDRLLIGEFVRRHHPRLAHEVAVHGAPGAEADYHVLDSLIEDRKIIADLAGLVARSHGAAVRSYLPLLAVQYNEREYRGVHPTLLMALLRVADYLQIEQERAPSDVLKIRKLASPVSLGEWTAHYAIKDIRHRHEDPEAIFVDAFPEDVTTFFKVQSWLEGIQHELDASWAVLGEVYGRWNDLAKFGLVIRRVHSSIDDRKAFASRVPYLPVRSAFGSSDADLLKLLIEPLYGDFPEVAVRELIQNSVDAVRELRQMKDDMPTLEAPRQSQQEAEVSVTVFRENDIPILRVADKGIGMTVDVIRNYFLKAGASFRRSHEWRRMFETDAGKATVLRAGRFGIGALASFLVGSELRVSTRHVTDREGITFRAGIETDLIELRRDDVPVGTTVEISLTESAFDRLTREQDSWDWYCLAAPSVQRVVLGDELKQRRTVPDAGAILDAAWRRTSHPEFLDIIWSYSKGPALICNGIEVRDLGGEMHYYSLMAEFAREYGLGLPRLVVSDPDGNLPLNLQRTGLIASLPFGVELFESIVRDFLAFAIVRGPRQWPGAVSSESPAYAGSVRCGSRYTAISDGDWFFTKNGFGYLDSHLLSRLGLRSAVVSTGFAEELEGMSETVLITTRPYETLGDIDNWLRWVVKRRQMPESASQAERLSWDSGGIVALNRLGRVGARFLISERMASRLDRLPKTVRASIVQEAAGDGWLLASIGACEDSAFDFARFWKARTASEAKRARGIAEIYFGSELSLPPMSPVAKRWLDVFGTEMLPFDESARAKLHDAAIPLLGECLSMQAEAPWAENDETVSWRWYSAAVE